MKGDGMDSQQDESMFEGEENPENTWIFFLLTPQWVRMRPTDAYYTVHPRQEGSAFRMSTAGKSVLMSLGSVVTADGGGSSSARGGLSQSHEDPGLQSRSTVLDGSKTSRAPKPNLSLIAEALNAM